MQLAFTFDFAAARSEERAAFEAFDALARSERVDEPKSTAAGQRWDAACDRLLSTPAGTAAGLGEKLALIEGREMAGWKDWSRHRDAIARDLLELRRPAATLHEPFGAWRAAFLAYGTGCDQSSIGDDAEQRKTALCDTTAQAFHALLAAPCASPGDFMLKVYVDGLQTLGRVEPGSWDIDIAQADHVTIFHDAWQRSAYRDLDQSDLGACLLAFGRLDFSASDWIERALALNVLLDVHGAGAGQVSLRINHHHPGQCERRQRERRRLTRLLAFDPSRTIAVGEAILRDWPQLVDQAAHAA